ncbi:uncharacterized protein DUF4352 [Microbacterium sp. BK668]|nr:uncharacterized protein DUF4352 [Microbacterium sp. BK668]
MCAAAALCIGLSACSVAPESAEGAPSRPSASASASPRSAPPTDSAPTPSASAPSPPSGADADQPVPKAGRGSDAAPPTQSAKPVTPAEPVAYPDGVTVRIAEVSYAEETATGPGSFPGRAFARLSLQLTNGSPEPIDLGTSVLTVLDKDGQPVAPVYAEEAEVRDFSGTLRPGSTATAVYAFAIPEESRSAITLVVDFDAAHTSAVFRGGLS